MTFEEKFNISPNASHEERYDAIIDGLGYENVKQYIPFSKTEIVEALKTDKHLNNLPLKTWDNATGYKYGVKLASLCQSARINGFCLAECVCILKRCAVRWAEESVSKFVKTLILPRQKANLYRALRGKSYRDAKREFGEDLPSLFCEHIDFDNGYRMTLKIDFCDGEDYSARISASLRKPSKEFANRYKPVGVHDYSTDFFQTWTLEHENITYMVNIEVEERITYNA